MNELEEYAIKRRKENWENKHKYCERKNIKYDEWLKTFDKEIESCKTPIIDLGCGKGNDTLYLTQKGKNVIPCDYSEKLILYIQKNFPELERTECFDMTKGLPFEDNFTDIIIADLSLHYFTKDTTYRILEEIKRVLKQKGILIFRVNSINDLNFGAKQGKEIEKHLYETEDGENKRFFDMEDIKKFFNTWDILYLKEEKIDRFSMQKVLWECKVQSKK